MKSILILLLIILTISLLFERIKHITQIDSYKKASTSYNHYKTYNLRKYPKPIITKLVDVASEEHQRVIRSLHLGEILVLVQETDNSKNAIKVVRKNGEQVGYLNKQLAEEISWTFIASKCSRPTSVARIIGDRYMGQILNVVIEICPLTVVEATAMSDALYPPM